MSIVHDYRVEKKSPPVEEPEKLRLHWYDSEGNLMTSEERSEFLTVAHKHVDW